MNTIIIWSLALIGMIYCLKWLLQRRKHGWAIEICDDLVILYLRQHWRHKRSDSNSAIEFKSQYTGATLYLIPGPKQDARVAIETATLVQMMTGIKVDNYTVPLPFKGRCGNGYFREQIIGSLAMSVIVLETSSAIYQVFTTDPNGSKRTGTEALQALKELRIVKRHAE